MTTRIAVRAITAVVTVAAGAVALAGCTGTAGTGATPSASAPNGSQAPRVVGTRVTQTCDELLPDGTFDVYGKTFTRVAHPRPSASSPAATIATQRGRVCQYRDEADDVTVTVAVAHLPETSLTNLKDTLYENSNSVPTYRVEGYFAKKGSVGRADAFADPYWIDARSSMFGEPGDAEPVIDAVRSALAPDTP